MKKLGLYIHIPICKSKCFYCDFYSVPGTSEKLRREYVNTLIKEIKYYGSIYRKKYHIDTVFIGGGTPTALDVGQISSILDAVRESFFVLKSAEISIECNPATLDGDRLAEYRNAGINRLSVGAQSFNDEELKLLGRIHRRDEIFEKMRMAREHGFRNINLDLMFGIPGQTMESWQKTVESAIRLKPKHISFYSLEIMENTVFALLREQGKLKETCEAEDREMYHHAISRLKKEGYIQYEISNCAKKYYECRHNLKYWGMEDYLGVGPSATSFVEGVRFSNVADLNDYIDAVTKQPPEEKSFIGMTGVSGSRAVDSYNENSFMDNVSEYVFTGLRRKEGINLRDFEKRFGNEFWKVYPQEKAEFMKFVEEGKAVYDGDTILITEYGFDISNKIMALFV